MSNVFKTLFLSFLMGCTVEQVETYGPAKVQLDTLYKIGQVMEVLKESVGIIMTGEGLHSYDKLDNAYHILDEVRTTLENNPELFIKNQKEK